MKSIEHFVTAYNTGISFTSAVVTLISFVLSIYAIWLARVSRREQNRAAKEQNKQFEDVITNANQVISTLRTVESQLSTIRISSGFPQHLDAITKVLNRAEKDIYIACQAAGYGVSINNDLYLDYQYALEKQKQKGVDVRILVSDSKSMDDFRNQQYGQGAEWDKVKDELRDQIAAMQLRKPGPIDTFEQFKAMMEFENKRAFDHLKGVVDIKDINYSFPLQMWIADDTEAVFAIKSFDRARVSNAFQTRDTMLIQSLISTWEYYNQLTSNQGIALAAGISGSNE